MDRLIQIWTEWCMQIKGYAWIPMCVALFAIACIFTFGGEQAVEKAKKKLFGGLAAVVCLAGIIYIPTWFVQQINF